MHFPTWVDLKGQDSVPETVHHVVCNREREGKGGRKLEIKMKGETKRYKSRMYIRLTDNKDEVLTVKLAHEC